MNSFIADFESRLDRFLYRCNAVPSIFAARAACGHGHVMVNGRVVVSTHTILKPGDIVEPAPHSTELFKGLMKRRLANNNFVFQKEGTPPSPTQALTGADRGAVRAERGMLLRDGASVGASYRRLPPPRGGGTSFAAGSQATMAPATDIGSADAQLWPGARQSQLDTIVLTLLAKFAPEGSFLASEAISRRHELSVRAAAQMTTSSAPAAALAWTPQNVDSASEVLSIDRVALRRVLLGLLATRPGSSN